jgi:predicted transcriptional regulator
MALGIRLTADQEERLNQVASAQGRTRSACVRQALDEYLARHGGNAALAVQQSRAVAQAAQQAELDWCELIPEWSDWTA